jgi:vancomycin resistance protein VanW
MKIWKETKRQVRLWLRVLQDWRSGEAKLFARSKTDFAEISDWHCHVLVQPIRPGSTFENKLVNLQLASAAITGIQLQPGEIFSFWEVVGRPCNRRGYRASRNIVRGQLSSEVGGGLCQVSGIIYQLCLMAGLEIRERYPHSLDIYTEVERFAPLGADATVVFGYKDLRLANPFPFPLVFCFETTASELQFKLFTPQPIQVKKLEFRLEMVGARKKVEILDLTPPNTEHVLAVSWYESLKSQ